jgi:hypothetical protein
VELLSSIISKRRSSWRREETPVVSTIMTGQKIERRMKEKKMDRIKVLEMIAADMKNDAENFDGRPFNGKTVAEYFGNQGAAIAALARITKSILEEAKEEKNGETDN